jgi:acetyl-CoA carboxylase biotin carboxylase subunit
MYLEKLIEEPRHIEIQVIGDSYGKACHLLKEIVLYKDVTKINETPSPFMTDELRLYGRCSGKSMNISSMKGWYC